MAGLIRELLFHKIKVRAKAWARFSFARAAITLRRVPSIFLGGIPETSKDKSLYTNKIYMISTVLMVKGVIGLYTDHQDNVEPRVIFNGKLTLEEYNLR